MKIYHLISHTIDPYCNIKYGDINEFSVLDHAVNKFLKHIITQDKNSQREHILVCLSSKIKTKELFLTHQDGYKIVVLKSFLLFYPFEISFGLIKFIAFKTHKKDIIHVHGISSFILETLFPFFFLRKFILHYRGGHFTWKAFPIALLKYGIFLFFDLLLAKYVFVENKTRLAVYQKRYFVSKKKLIYIPGIVDIKFPKENMYLHRQSSHTGSMFNIVFVGRLEKAKGIYDIVEVFNIFHSKYPDSSLLIAGDGSLKSYIKSISGDSKVIRYYGFLSNLELQNLYGKASIFVLPTYFDSFGIVLIEAMSFGIPCISTFTEGPGDIIDDQHSGLLFYPGDKISLLEKLEKLYSDDDLKRKISNNGYVSVLQKFSGEESISKVLSIYDRLLSE